MERKIMKELIAWKNQTTHRMPLLLYGARQVGKTYAMRRLGDLEFKNTVYVNFESDRAIGAYFQTDITPDALLRILESYYKVQIVPDQTLIIFDEIQMCQRALTSLKYFAEDAPEYHIIAAGSLLGVALSRQQASFPVGKVKMLTMYPLDFEEFLWARGKHTLAETIRSHFASDTVMASDLHQEALKEYDTYCILGGMPAAVAAEMHGNVPLSQGEIRQMILDSYIADMTKYAEPKESIKIFAAYDSLPAQLAKDNKKFQYKMIQSGARASQYGDSIDWLVRAGIVIKCSKCTQGYLPPAAYQDLSSFKLYYSDTGLLSAKTGITLQNLHSPESDLFRGIYAENYVACTLRANGYELFYWESDGKAEVDFLILRNDQLIPVESKAGTHVKAKSLALFCEKYHPPYAIRISERNFGLSAGIKSVPLYAAFCI